MHQDAGGLVLPVPPGPEHVGGGGDLQRKWTWSVEWLHDELERGGGHRASYASTAGRINITGKYNEAHCLIISGFNETANGYFLERSQSARLTLEKACELMPDEDGDEGVGGAEGVGAAPGVDLDERKEGSLSCQTGRKHHTRCPCAEGRGEQQSAPHSRTRPDRHRPSI